MHKTPETRVSYRVNNASEAIILAEGTRRLSRKMERRFRNLGFRPGTQSVNALECSQ
jgi:hypothetical protein